MGTGPTGKCISAEARVDQPQCRLDQGIAQFRVKERELSSSQHSLVDNGPAGETGNIKHAALMDAAPGCFADSLANCTEFSLEGEVVGNRFPSGDEDLPNDWLRSLRRQSKR